VNYPFHFECDGDVAARPESLFEHLDDPHRLSSHMERGSAAMAGAAMKIDTDEGQGRTPGSVIRMRGRMLGIALTLEQAIAERQPPRLKIWETLGEQHLIVIGAYRMGFRIAASARGSLLTVFIDYGLPSRLTGRWLGRVLAPAYARWCCRRMVADAQRAFSASAAPGHYSAGG
jgi:hypothetical protein